MTTKGKIIKWVTYKGRRFPITEKTLGGIRLGTKKETLSYLNVLKKSPLGAALPFRRAKRLPSLVPLLRGSRKIRKKFPGSFDDAIVHYGNSSPTFGGYTASPEMYEMIQENVKNLISMPADQLQSISGVSKEEIPLVRELFKTAGEMAKKIKVKETNVFINTKFNPEFAVGTYISSEEDLIIHELGHVFHGRIPKNFKERWFKLYLSEAPKIESAYGQTSFIEAFAEEFLRFIKTGKNSTSDITKFFSDLEKEWKLL